MFKVSTGLRNHILAGGSLIQGLAGAVIKLYAGAEPTSANASIVDATLLCTLTVDGLGGGLGFEPVPTNGSLVKSTSEFWRGENVASGLCTFYRFEDPADAGGESTTAKRTQGSVAVMNADLWIAEPNLTLGQEQRLDYYAIGMPASAG